MQAHSNIVDGILHHHTYVSPPPHKNTGSDKKKTLFLPPTSLAIIRHFQQNIIYFFNLRTFPSSSVPFCASSLTSFRRKGPKTNLFRRTLHKIHPCCKYFCNYRHRIEEDFFRLHWAIIILLKATAGLSIILLIITTLFTLCLPD